MISYELAKKMKDAGFPFKKTTVQEGQNIFTGDHFFDGPITVQAGQKYDRIPTLSELIDACGDSFGKLERIKIGENVSWYAHESKPQTISIMMNYSTPEEAVVKLWLSINKSEKADE